MRRWWQDLTDLVLPAECGGCGAPRTMLCPRCRAGLAGAFACRVRPDPEPAGLPPVHAAAPYTDEVRAVLLAHKERGALALARPLGVTLARAVGSGLWEARAGPSRPRRERVRQARTPVLLVPVPSARRAVRARGHDPVRRIAFAAAGELRRAGLTARVVAVLRQRRAVADQSGLDSRQRLANLAGALEVAPDGPRLLAGGRVVLVDDLMTTGASLAEAARAVTAAGVRPTVEKAVYASGAREGRKTRIAVSREEKESGAVRVQGKSNTSTAGQLICAAVIAASPDSFELNRN